MFQKRAPASLVARIFCGKPATTFPECRPSRGKTMFDLTGRTALVTGATGDIGAAIARAFHASGAVVAISGRRTDRLDALAGQLGGRVHVLPCNLANRQEVENLVPGAETAMGHVDILVSNAGIT